MVRVNSNPNANPNPGPNLGMPESRTALPTDSSLPYNAARVRVRVRVRVMVKVRVMVALNLNLICVDVSIPHLEGGHHCQVGLPWDSSSPNP